MKIPGIHLVAAYTHQTRVALAKAEAETLGKGHELAGAHAVLDQLGATSAASANSGHFFVVLKDNQPLTCEAVALSFADL